MKKEFDLGTAVHAQVLGVGAPIVEIPDALLASNGALSTKAGKEFDALHRSEGRLPMKSPLYRATKSATEAVLAHPEARLWLEQEGNAEASMFATDPETGVEVRARFDWLAAGVVDLKSTSKAGGATYAGFQKAVANFGYDVQEEHYCDVHEFAVGARPEVFTFIVVELEPPYAVGVYQLTEEWRRMGRAKAREARRRFAECTSSGVWPSGIPEEVQMLEPPRWAVSEFEREYAA